MKKTVFKNKYFYWLLIIYLFLLLAWNINTLILGNVIAILPILAQSFLIILILTRNKYTKMGIKIWAIFLIIGPSLSILGKSLKLLVGDDLNILYTSLIYNSLFLIIGALVYSFNDKTVKLEKE